MIGIVGIIVIFVMVFGGYLLAGGKFGIILKSLPFEMMMIGGAAVGAFLISNSGSAAKHAVKDIGKVFKGAKWKAEDYRDLLVLLFELIRLARQNPVGWKNISKRQTIPPSSPRTQRFWLTTKPLKSSATRCDRRR